MRVNDPRADRFQIVQTTQSETTIAVAGRNVAVGYNDSQRALFAAKLVGRGRGRPAKNAQIRAISQEEATRKVGVSRTLVQAALLLLNRGVTELVGGPGMHKLMKRRRDDEGEHRRHDDVSRGKLVGQGVPRFPGLRFG